MAAIPVVAALLGSEAGMLGAARSPGWDDRDPSRAAGRLRCAPRRSATWATSRPACGALREADVVACEDTRRTARLLAAHDISVPLVVLHDHNEARADSRAARAAGGRRLAWALGLRRRPARRLRPRPHPHPRRHRLPGHDVEVLPGASAVTGRAGRVGPAVGTAFAFLGFLPRGETALQRGCWTRPTPGG